MTTVQRDELYRLVDSVHEDNLEEARRILLVLSEDPEELTDEELANLDLGLEEIRRGETVPWEDVKRTDV